MILARGLPFDQIRRETSRDADLALLGMAAPGEDDGFADYCPALRERTEGLPATLFVLAAQDIELGHMVA